MNIAFTALESLYTIVYNVVHHGCEKENKSQREATILDLVLGRLSSNIDYDAAAKQ